MEEPPWTGRREEDRNPGLGVVLPAVGGAARWQERSGTAVSKHLRGYTVGTKRGADGRRHSRGRTLSFIISFTQRIPVGHRWEYSSEQN